MRPFVVLQLIRLLRSSGYPGYASNGIKSDSNIERRMGERYTDKYEGHVKFIPDAIFNIVDARKLQGKSIVSDKLATPPEPERDLRQWEKRNGLST